MHVEKESFFGRLKELASNLKNGRGIGLLVYCFLTAGVVFLFLRYKENFFVDDLLLLFLVIWFFILSDAVLFLFVPKEILKIIKAKVRTVVDESIIFGWFIISLVIISLVIIAFEYTGKLVSPWKDICHILDLAVLIIFFIEYYVRFLAAEEPKLKHVFRPINIIDALALLDLFRVFRLIRIFRLLRLIRLAKIGRRVRLITDSAAHFMLVLSGHTFEFIVITLLSVIAVIGSTMAVYHFEKIANPKMATYWDAVYWSIISMLSTQVNDPVQSAGGKLTSIFVVLMGILLISTLIGSIAASLTEKIREIRQGGARVNCINHTIITGDFEEVNSVLTQLRSPKVKNSKSIVIISEDVRIEQLTTNKREIYFVRGNPADKQTLLKANTSQASTAIILSESSAPDYQAVLTALALESFTLEHGGKNIHTCLSFKEIKDTEPFRKLHVDDLICLRGINDNLVVCNAVNQGLAGFFNELLTYQTDNSNICRFKVPSPYVGLSFLDLFIRTSCKRIIPLGVLRQKDNYQGSPKDKYQFFLNPSAKEFIFQENDYVFAIAEHEPTEKDLIAICQK